MLKKLFPFILIGIFLLVALQPLFQPGFYPMHDDEQVGRVYQLDKALSAGHFPPRLTPDLGYGYNYLLFNFYPPFVYYVAQIFHVLGFSYIVSVKLMIAVGFVLAAVFMYLFVKEFSGKIGGVVAAVAYSYVPYRAVDVYVRGALPEFWSFVFIPALFWSFYRLFKTGNSLYLVLSAVFIAFQILTHNLVAMMSSLFLGPFLLYLLFFSKQKLRFTIQSAGAGVMGLLLSAYFWIPSFFEKKFTMVDLLTTELADYDLHYVYIRQFLDSPWGFGGSLYGLFDGMSFEVGKVHLILLGLSLLVLGFAFLKRKKTYLSLNLFFILLFFFSLFIQTFHSKFIWDLLPPFAYIQFPWRFLLFSAFTASFVIGTIFLYIKNKKLQYVLAALVIVSIMVFNSQYFQPSEYLKGVTDKDYTADNIIKWKTSRMAAEYVPKGIVTRKTDANYSVVDITEDKIATKSYEIVKGDLNVQELVNKPQVKQYKVMAQTPGEFRINSYAYPGWKVWMDGQEIQYSDDNPYKLITLDVPVGTHSVKAEFTATVVRAVADMISVVVLVAILIFLVNYQAKFITIDKQKKKL